MRCREARRKFALQREGKGKVSILPMMVARNGRYYLASSSTEGATPGKIVLEKMTAEKRFPALVAEKREEGIIFKLCNHW